MRSTCWSVLLIENVRLGRYPIGLGTDAPATRDLIHYPVVDEPMVRSRSMTTDHPVRDIVAPRPSLEKRGVFDSPVL